MAGNAAPDAVSAASVGILGKPYGRRLTGRFNRKSVKPVIVNEAAADGVALGDVL
jgi:hypothetical protein